MKFSEQYAGYPLPKSGLGEASPELRTALWNLFHRRLIPETGNNKWTVSQASARAIWHFLRWATDEIPHSEYDIRRTLKAQWFSCEWAKFFDLLQFVADFAKPEDDYSGGGAWFETLNIMLETEGCAYRFIAERLAPITNEMEIEEITRAARSRIDLVEISYDQKKNARNIAKRTFVRTDT
jgi:AbiJ N-terminal domain 4